MCLPSVDRGLAAVGGAVVDHPEHPRGPRRTARRSSPAPPACRRARSRSTARSGRTAGPGGPPRPPGRPPPRRVPSRARPAPPGPPPAAGWVAAAAGLDGGLLGRRDDELARLQPPPEPAGVPVQHHRRLGGEGAIAGKLQERCCQGLSASSFSHRHSVETDTWSIRPVVMTPRGVRPGSSGQAARPWWRAAHRRSP
jgi:hypothetical protein